MGIEDFSERPRLEFPHRIEVRLGDSALLRDEAGDVDPRRFVVVSVGMRSPIVSVAEVVLIDPSEEIQGVFGRFGISTEEHDMRIETLRHPQPVSLDRLYIDIRSGQEWTHTRVWRGIRQGLISEMGDDVDPDARHDQLKDAFKEFMNKRRKKSWRLVPFTTSDSPVLPVV